MKCHAGANHGPATDCGAWGWLCASCWTRCLALLKRLLKSGDEPAKGT